MSTSIAKTHKFQNKVTKHPEANVSETMHSEHMNLFGQWNRWGRWSENNAHWVVLCPPPFPPLVLDPLIGSTETQTLLSASLTILYINTLLHSNTTQQTIKNLIFMSICSIPQCLIRYSKTINNHIYTHSVITSNKLSRRQAQLLFLVIVKKNLMFNQFRWYSGQCVGLLIQRLPV